MKTIINKITLTLMMLIFNVAIFAQPNPDPGTGDPDPDDTLAPIDENIYILLALGLLFVAYKFYTKKQIAK